MDACWHINNIQRLTFHILSFPKIHRGHFRLDGYDSSVGYVNRLNCRTTTLLPITLDITDCHYVCFQRVVRVRNQPILDMCKVLTEEDRVFGRQILLVKCSRLVANLVRRTNFVGERLGVYDSYREVSSGRHGCNFTFRREVRVIIRYIILTSSSRAPCYNPIVGVVLLYSHKGLVSTIFHWSCDCIRCVSKVDDLADEIVGNFEDIEGLL